MVAQAGRAAELSCYASNKLTPSSNTLRQHSETRLAPHSRKPGIWRDRCSNNREAASFIWLSALLMWAFSKAEIRKSGFDALRAALAWKIVLSILMMMAYVALVVLALRGLGLWQHSNLKDTILWLLTVALVMVFEVGSVIADGRYFEKAVLDGLKLSVLLGFVVNFYVLSLPLVRVS